MSITDKNSQFLYEHLFKKENVIYNYILIICVNKTTFIHDIRHLQNSYKLKTIKLNMAETEHDYFSIFEETNTKNLLMITTLFNVMLNDKLKQYENILFRNSYENIVIDSKLTFSPNIITVNIKLIKHLKLHEHKHSHEHSCELDHTNNNEIYKYKIVKSTHTILLNDIKSTGVKCVMCTLKITGKLIKLQLNEGDKLQNYCHFCSTHTKHRNYARNVIQEITNETINDIYIYGDELWAMFYINSDNVTIYTMEVSNRSYVKVYHSLGNFIVSTDKLSLIKFKLNNPHSTERLIYFSG